MDFEFQQRVIAEHRKADEEHHRQQRENDERRHAEQRERDLNWRKEDLRNQKRDLLWGIVFSAILVSIVTLVSAFISAGFWPFK